MYFPNEGVIVKFGHSFDELVIARDALREIRRTCNTLMLEELLTVVDSALEGYRMCFNCSEIIEKDQEFTCVSSEETEDQQGCTRVDLRFRYNHVKCPKHVH